MNEFNGECYIILGLNNSLKAEMEPFANEYGRNLQDVDGMFELLDDTLKKVLPKATIKLAPVLDVENDAWNRSELKQKIFKEFNANIMKRNHLQFDPTEPKRLKLFDREGVHLDDSKSVDFWTNIFMQ